jgi:hypothetical protein
MPLRIASALLLTIALAAAAAQDTIDVLTLRDGRVLEGTYDAESATLTLSGKIKGSMKVEKKDILRLEVKKAPKVEAVAAAPMDPARKEEIRLATLRMDLNRQKEQKANAERVLAQLEQRNQSLPELMRSTGERLDAAKRILADAESRKISEASWSDWYYRNYNRRWAPGDGGATAAEGARRRAQADAAEIQRDFDKATAERKKLDRELPLTRTRIDQLAARIAELEGMLAAAPPPAPGPALAPRPLEDLPAPP